MELPFEIWQDEICGKFLKQHRSALLNLALCCRKTYYACFPALYSCISLGTFSDSLKFERKQLPSLGFPHWELFVRELFCDYRRFCAYQSHKNKSCPDTELMNFVQSCRFLEKLVLICDFSRLCSTFVSFFALPTLTKLHVDFFMAECTWEHENNVFPNIKELGIYNFCGKKMSFALCLMFPKLKTLTISHFANLFNLSFLNLKRLNIGFHSSDEAVLREVSSSPLSFIKITAYVPINFCFFQSFLVRHLEIPCSSRFFKEMCMMEWPLLETLKVSVKSFYVTSSKDLTILLKSAVKLEIFKQKSRKCVSMCFNKEQLITLREIVKYREIRNSDINLLLYGSRIVDFSWNVSSDSDSSMDVSLSWNLSSDFLE